MEQGLSLITLGVRDLAVARRFYVETLGWQPMAEPGADVAHRREGRHLYRRIAYRGRGPDIMAPAGLSAS